MPRTTRMPQTDDFKITRTYAELVEDNLTFAMDEYEINDIDAMLDGASFVGPQSSSVIRSRQLTGCFGRANNRGGFSERWGTNAKKPDAPDAQYYLLNAALSHPLIVAELESKKKDGPGTGPANPVDATDWNSYGISSNLASWVERGWVWITAGTHQDFVDKILSMGWVRQEPGHRGTATNGYVYEAPPKPIETVETIDWDAMDAGWVGRYVARGSMVYLGNDMSQAVKDAVMSLGYTRNGDYYNPPV